MNKKIFFFTLILLSSLWIYGQNEKNIWYFGNKAGLDFSTNPPTPLTNGSFVSVGFEGAASISDLNGNILLYTNGETVWDKSHAQMQNGTGLFGTTTSIQSAIIVPLPGTYNVNLKRFDFYYIFTLGDHYSNGVCYSIVDMSLNGGLGGVTTKNINIVPGGGKERIAIARHADKCSYWVITTPRGTNNQFNSFLLSDTGIATTPVISSVTASNDSYGALKVSPNNKMVAMADGDILGIYSLNDTTGVLTNKLIYHQSNGPQAYGVEFSPNSELVYISGFPGARITQFDLNSTNNANFINSGTVIGGQGGNMINGSLQLANNGKIYFAPASFLTGSHNSLSVINSPNIIGTGCNFTANNVSLGGRSTHWGLPHFAPHFEKDTTDIISEYVCGNDSVRFSLDSIPYSLKSVYWKITHESNPAVIHIDTIDFEFSMPANPSGRYFIFAELNYTCYTDSLYDTLTVMPPGNFSIGNDTIICSTDSLLLNAGIGFDSYLWNDGSVNQSIIARNSGLYWCEVTYNNGMCNERDSININFDLSNFNSLIEFDSVNCFNGNSGEIRIYPNGTPYLYSLNNGAPTSDSVFSNLSAGIHTISLEDTNGCSIDSLIEIFEPDSLYIIIDSSQFPSCHNSCDGAIWFNTTGGKQPYSYFFNQTSSSSMIANICDGINNKFSVVDNSGCTDSVFYAFDTIKPITISPLYSDTCIDQQIAVGVTTNNGQGKINYHWSNSLINNDSTLLIYPNSDTNIIVYASDTNQCYSDTVEIKLNLNPIINISVLSNQICLDEVVEFSQSLQNNVTLSNCEWLFGDGGQATGCSNTLYTYDNIGSYNITYIAETDKGCKDTVREQNFVNIVAPPIANFDYEPKNPIAGQVINFNNTSYLNDFNIWNINNTPTSSSENYSDVYGSSIFEVCLNVARFNGCKDTLCDSIFVKSIEEFFVPNTFTPNKDGINDIFNVHFSGNSLENYTLLIFNRWGELIYNTNNINNYWDGTYKNKNCPIDTYVWKINAKINRDKEIIYINKIGHVNLIR